MDRDGLFGHVNDSIRGLATETQMSETWDFFCECSDLTCHTLVRLTMLEFDERRAASPPVPILATEHMRLGAYEDGGRLGVGEFGEQ